MKRDYMKNRLIKFCNDNGYILIYLVNRDVFLLQYGDTRHYFPSLASLYKSVFVYNDYWETDYEVRIM